LRYLIVSDMHGNADAFAAVLEHTASEDFDVSLVLGDLVGYGAAPNQVVEQVRQLHGTVYTVRGNHDKVVAGIDSGEYFNQAARTAATGSGSTARGRWKRLPTVARTVFGL